ncbi:MAG TPA: YceI family protein [Puia sp.]|nr:YceI family protein [Puia sp.]
MKRLVYPALALLVLAGSAFNFLANPDWKITEGYSIAWSIAGSDAAGIFKTFTGSIAFDDQDPGAGKFDVTVNVASINTGNGLQNNHAKSAEWFDAARYPTIRFVSRSVSAGGGGYQVTGDLSMHGVKKTVTIPFRFNKTAQGGTFTGSFTVNRSDFKIGQPGGDVGEQIRIDVSVPVMKS